MPAANTLIDFLGAKVGLVRPKLIDRANSAHAFDMKRHMTGVLRGQGAIFDYAGRMNDGFRATMRCAWDGDVCAIDEDFSFDHGRQDKRIWRIAFTSPTDFAVSGSDILSGGGQASGDAVRMLYRIRAEVAGKPMELDMDDWTFLAADGSLINRSRMIKSGLAVGEIFAVFRREDA